MRSHRKLIVLMFVLPLWLWLGSAFAEESQPLKRGVLVLPLQAGTGLKDEQVALGFAVQNVLENVLTLHSDFEDVWFNGNVEKLFPQEQDLQAWVRGKAQIPKGVTEIGMRYLLTGQMTLQGKDIHAKLNLSDRQNGGKYSKDLLLDLPGLAQFRQEFINLLAQADIPAPKTQRPKMLWAEELPPRAFTLLGQGLWERFTTSAYQKDHPIYNAKPFDNALAVSPRSYLLLNNRGILYFYEQKEADASLLLKKALAINPTGAAATRNLQFLSLKAGDTDSVETWTKKKAEIQGKDPNAAMMDIWIYSANEAYSKGDHHTALVLSKQAFNINRIINDQAKKAIILNALGLTYYALGQHDNAIESSNHALVIYREVKNRSGEGEALQNLGNTYQALKQYDKALENSNKALAIYREVKNRAGEGQVLHNLGSIYQALNQNDKAIESSKQALAIYREVKNRSGEGGVLQNLGNDYRALKQYDKAFEFYTHALAIFREVKNHSSEGEVLLNLGAAYFDQHQYDKAIETSDQALAIFREVKNREGEGHVLNNLGSNFRALRQYDKAIESTSQAFIIYREVKNRSGEAQALHNLGIDYQSLSQYDKAIDNFMQALAIYREVRDQEKESQVLISLGNCYIELGVNNKAVDYFMQALSLNRKLRNLTAEADTLNKLGFAYQSSDHKKALDYSTQALAICRKARDRTGEASALSYLGLYNLKLSEYAVSINYYTQALAIQRELKNRYGEAAALFILGSSYRYLHQYDLSIDYFTQALAIVREPNYQSLEGIILSGLGLTYNTLHDYDKAINNYVKALEIERKLNTHNLGSILGNLMSSWKEQNNPRLAIYYGKQAVNTYQEIRGHILKQDINLQQIFLKDKEPTYRILADLLIGEGRLPEAQQVLGMLKEEEYFDFIRRDADDVDNLTARTELTPQEADADRRYREIADRLTTLGTERGALEAKIKRSAEEEKRLTQLETDLTVAGQAFEKFLNGLETEFTNVASANARVLQLREAQGMMEDLRELGSGTVAVYTLVSENKYHVILITPELQLAREFAISAAELNRKVLAFREALQNPNKNPQPLAQELYQILIAPLENDLKGAKAETLLWSLDGVLRYLPIAALHDGQSYFAEHYRNVVFTPASQARLKDMPKKTWKALGFGVSQAHEGFKALPSVVDELGGIIHVKGASKTGGVLPGIVKLDQSFTQDTMLAALRGRDHPVVHIASHFRFQPGDETASFLLLGDGSHLPLSQFKTLPNVFRGVDLLALSACNTATGDAGANGKEVEGFGVLAQRQGAKAVIATLWPVADASTKELMQSFYRIREKGASKAEALQEAQLSLLRGETQISAKSKVGRNSKADSSPEKPKSKAKTFYSHPYFWAPFILIGNSL
jgi:CHAT domain-containing protein/Flp pilus assembly protein TadD